MAVVSENGYLFLWNLLTTDLIYSSKIHGGSVEALSWKHDLLTCCSSDCTFSLIEIEKEKKEEVDAKI